MKMEAHQSDILNTLDHIVTFNEEELLLLDDISDSEFHDLLKDDILSIASDANDSKDFNDVPPPHFTRHRNSRSEKTFESKNDIIIKKKLSLSLIRLQFLIRRSDISRRNVLLHQNALLEFDMMRNIHTQNNTAKKNSARHNLQNNQLSNDNHKSLDTLQEKMKLSMLQTETSRRRFMLSVREEKLNRLEHMFEKKSLTSKSSKLLNLNKINELLSGKRKSLTVELEESRKKLRGFMNKDGKNNSSRASPA